VVVVLLLVIVAIIVFAGLGFAYHVLWVGVLVGLFLVLFQLVRAGLDPNHPAGRLNIGLLGSVGRFLVEISGRAAGRQQPPLPAEPSSSRVVPDASGRDRTYRHAFPRRR
jgi:hypothetical protein